MTRRYDDPIEVHPTAGAPELFVWRGRRYRVGSVLAHWSQARPWWHQVARRSSGSGADLVGSVPGGSAPGAGSSSGGSSVDRAPGGLAALATDRTYWRVEASVGRSARSGVYDLALDAQGWTLVRVSD